MNIQDATAKELAEHEIREPYDRSRGQIQQVLDLCEQYKNKYNKEITFSNTWANHYKLTVNEQDFEFTVYKDVINALKLALI